MANEIQPMVNGIRHAWSSVRMNMLGRTVDGVAQIEYDDTQEKQNNYGAGKMPNHRGLGRYSATCKMTLYQFEVVALQQAIGGLRLQSIPPFDITVTYLPEGADDTVVDVIRNCEFTTNGRSLSEGDMMSQHEFELIVSHIKWHGQTEY